MEGKKTSIVEDLFGFKDNKPKPKSSDVFGFSSPPPNAKATSHWKQGHEAKLWNDKSTTPDNNYTGSARKKYPSGPSSPSNLSSSLYYGGQDVCSNYPSPQASANLYSNQRHEQDEEKEDHDTSNMASRGNWWQGSLYY